MSLVEKLNHKTLTIIIVAIVILYIIASFFMLVYGMSEEDCVAYTSDHLKVIESSHISDCGWLVDKLLYNGSGFQVSGYSVDGYAGLRSFVLTR